MNELKIVGFSGYAVCNASFGKHNISFDEKELSFSSGINVLEGSIDSTAWAISYTVSMYGESIEDFVGFDEPEIIFNKEKITLKEIVDKSCYMDRCYSMHSSECPIKDIIEQELVSRNSSMSAGEVCELFGISKDRAEMSVKRVGNEKYRCMAAIGYACEKKIFCFPWTSKKMMLYYGRNMTDVLETLNSLDVIVLLPTEFIFKGNGVPKKIHDFDVKKDSYLYEW